MKPYVRSQIFADALGGSVYHYRDKDGLECDAVVHLRNGSYGLIEIKPGGNRLIEEGVRTLTALGKKSMCSALFPDKRVTYLPSAGKTTSPFLPAKACKTGIW
jgi:hypothetical protein